MEVIDLQSERAIRASESLEEALRLIDEQIADLSDPDVKRGKDAMTRLLMKRASVEKRLTMERAAEARASEKAMKDAARAEREAMIEAMSSGDLRDATKADIREWLKANDYYYTHNDATYWLYSPKSDEPWTPHARSTMVNHDPRLDSRSPYFDLFTEVLQEDKRWFRNHARTFAKVPPDTLNMLRWNFLQPKEGDHHFIFDMLLMSLGGGKQENIDHLEKVLVAKWCNPANYTLPTIVISDDGGTGKSLFAEKVLPVIFGADLVAPNVAMEEVTGQFNSHLTGKAVWFINENRADKNDQDGVKRVLGSATIRSERKGKDAKKATNTALVFVVGNFTLGAIKLAGSEVDRRFSVMKNSAPLHTYTQLVMEMDADAAKTWMWTEGQHILSDPDQVAMWLNHLLAKHGRITHLNALHGQDYAEMLEGQAETHHQCYRAFFNSPQFTVQGYFKQPTLFAFYTDYCKEHGVRMMSNQRFYAEAETWLKRNGIDYQRIAAAKWGHTTAGVFWNPQIGKPVGGFPANDDQFFTTDERGKRSWKLEIN